MRIFSLRENLLWPLLSRCTPLERHVRAKATKNNHPRTPFSAPLLRLHPSSLTNVPGSQGATVLLSGPFPFLTPEVQAVAKVPPTLGERIMELNAFDLSGKKKQWLKAFHFSGLLSAYKEEPFNSLCLRRGLQVNRELERQTNVSGKKK